LITSLTCIDKLVLKTEHRGHIKTKVYLILSFVTYINQLSFSFTKFTIKIFCRFVRLLNSFRQNICLFNVQK